MLIRTITKNADEALYLELRQAYRQATSWGALYFAYSQLPEPMPYQIAQGIVSGILQDVPSAMYVLANGDVIITWKGPQKALLEQLTPQLYAQTVPATFTEEVHKYFDMLAQADLLRRYIENRLIDSKVAAEVREKIEPPERPAPSLFITSDQKSGFARNAPQRKGRKSPLILIVEDQPFWSKLLVAMIGVTYKTIVAENAVNAFSLYATHAPDMVFLDLELPDLNGQEVLKQLVALDAQAFITMVTGNHNLEEMAKARASGVKGFITKPLNQSKIRESLEQYARERH